MSNFERCAICDEYDFVSNHKCKPLWLVTPEDCDPEVDAWHIYAVDAEEAATKFAERYDQETAEYSIVSGEDVLVLVTDEQRENQTWFEVEGYSVPEYSASEADPPQGGDDAH